MGPRLFSRGEIVIDERGIILDELQWGRGFSAAERYSGIRTVRTCSKLQWGRGFSAAESPTGMFSAHLCGMASMGPRLFSRGEGMVRRNRSPRRVCFNGAAAFQPRRVRAYLVDGLRRLASMGPRLFSRGEADFLNGLTQVVRASMGPRLFSRGEYHGAVQHAWVGFEASMGPRLFSRGEYHGVV